MSRSLRHHGKVTINNPCRGIHLQDDNPDYLPGEVIHIDPATYVPDLENEKKEALKFYAQLKYFCALKKYKPGWVNLAFGRKYPEDILTDEEKIIVKPVVNDYNFNKYFYQKGKAYKKFAYFKKHYANK